MKQSLMNMDRPVESDTHKETETPSSVLIHYDEDDLTEVKKCLVPDLDDKREKAPESLLSNTNSVENDNNNSLSKIPPRLVQHCGSECMLSEKIVDKLLSRMMKLENERSELHAANRSWSVQYKLMKDQYMKQIDSLKEEIKSLKKDKEQSDSKRSEGKAHKNISTNPCNSSQNQMDLLTHQAQVYKEDFLEERKARTRAHSQIEALKSELKRERKSRAKLAVLVQQQKQISCEKSREKAQSTVIEASN